MMQEQQNVEQIFISGKGSLVYSIAACLLKSNYDVTLQTDNENEASEAIQVYFSDMKNENGSPKTAPYRLFFFNEQAAELFYQFAIIITAEDIVKKKNLISELDKLLPAETIIAINTESFALNEIQSFATCPERIIGVNWTEPAHTTLFLEIITNEKVMPGVIEHLKNLAKKSNKDYYVVENFGVRSKLLSAMVREAFYLVENGYATVEDIDRACRNDGGYYLPFAGNCRYMDLMGTYAYAMVMKDLNPDLSKSRELPQFFNNILNKGGKGMENGEGLYSYSTKEVTHWKKIAAEFSYQIEKIINKYPFDYEERKSINNEL